MNVFSASLKFILVIIMVFTGILNAQVGEIIWEENFNDLENWNKITGNGVWGWGNGELAYYKNENVEITEIPGEPENMGLHITAREETGPGIVDQWGNPLNYTSGKVTTKAKVAVKYGMIETRVRIPDLDLGGWPAVWLLGTSNYNWPNCGEIDIMEMGSNQAFRDLHDEHNGGNGLDNSTVNQVIGANAIFYSDDAVTPENPTGAASISWDPDDEYCRPYYNYAHPLIERFLIYRLYWDTESLRFTVVDEGMEYDLYTDIFSIDSVSEEFRQPFYLIANLAIGGSFTDAYNLGDPASGEPVSMPLPGDMYVDYIKVYEWNGQGEVRVGPPYPESGSFGIYTDNTPTNGGLEAGLSSEIYVWEGTLTDGSIAPYEGENGISWQTAGSGWFGAGIMSVQPVNMINFGEGNLKFMIHIPADVTFKIGIIDAWGNQNYVEFPANQTAYGLLRNGSWGQASIPVSELRGEAIDLRMLSYEFVILNEDGSFCEFGLDDIYWDGGGVPNAPMANAGPDQIVEDIDGNGSEPVTLDGSGSSDPDGTIDVYSWTTADTVLTTGENPTVDLSLGVHVITLTVTDNDGKISSDQVQITVLDNFPPQADAGPDQVLVDADGNGIEPVTLDGSGSSDPDGSIISYAWSKLGAEIATGENPILELETGVHLITLTVTDNEGEFGTDAVVIRINNDLPISAPAIYYADEPITIDETIELAWFDTPEMEINNVTVGTRTEDFYAQWKAMYDDIQLYVLVEVNDNSLMNDSGNEWYKDDCVEIFIDGDNSSGTTYDGINDFQFGFRWDDETIELGNNSVPNTTGIDFSMYNTDVGYNIEVSIPWSMIGVSPVSLTTIGFDVAVDDDDDGGDRECAVASIFTSDNAWHNPSVFGNVELVNLTGISENGSEIFPTQFKLLKNFPNPFNPATAISYVIPRFSNVELSIYNSLGQEIKQLVKSSQKSGTYHIQWNGKDEIGHSVPSGIYFYQLKANNFIQTKKMLLIK